MGRVLNVGVLSRLSRDGWILFITRALRLLAYGATAVILALYLPDVGLPDARIGLLMTGTLLGDAAISLAVTYWADDFGRRRMLVLGCLLKVVAGAVFAYVAGPDFWLLLLAAIVGVISPSGNDVGPFQALEQSILADQVPASKRISLFAWYNLMGSLMTAIGSLLSGFLTETFEDKLHISLLNSYRLIFAGYAVLAVLKVILTMTLSSNVETEERAAAQVARQHAAAPAGDTESAAPLITAENSSESLNSDLSDVASESSVSSVAALHGVPKQTISPAADIRIPPARRSGRFHLSPQTRPAVIKLTLLFATDSFAGGLVTGSLLAYYFHLRFGVDNTYLGGLLFIANILSAFSSLASGWLANRIGLINTMVCTHLPASLLLIAIPLMPNLHLATAMVFARFLISQMDNAPRQSYLAGIVPSKERTATMGIVNIGRALGAALGPSLTGFLSGNQLFDWAFFIAGGIKVAYDLLLLWSFHSLKADDEPVRPLSRKHHKHGNADIHADSTAMLIGNDTNSYTAEADRSVREGGLTQNVPTPQQPYV